jgi:hypothetical protein
MSTSHFAIGKRDPTPKDAPSIYAKLVHAEDSEILSWAVKAAISDLGTEIRHTDHLAMRKTLHDRKQVFLLLLNRLLDGSAAVRGDG